MRSVLEVLRGSKYLVQEAIVVTTGKVTTRRLDRNVERGSSDNLDCGDKGRLERDHGCSQRCPTERCVAAEKAGEHISILRSVPLNLYPRGSWMSVYSASSVALLLMINSMAITRHG